MKNLAALVVTLLFAFELYLCTAAEQHRKKKIQKGWNVVKGTITAIEKKEDAITHKQVNELTIETPDGRKVYAKAGLLHIFEEGEEAILQEKDGYHKFVGTENSHKRGTKELMLGLIPVAIILVISVICAILF